MQETDPHAVGHAAPWRVLAPRGLFSGLPALFGFLVIHVCFLIYSFFFFGGGGEGVGV